MNLSNGISIIVTVFNKDKYIEKTLSSIISQMNDQTELIVINDGSTDKSLQKIKFALRKCKFKYYIIDQKNTGPSIAINNGLKKAKYSYTKLVDGDDILSPDAINFMKKEMESNDLDLLYGDWKWVKNVKTFTFPSQKNTTRTIVNPLKNFILRGWGGSSNMMIKTSVFKAIGGCDANVFVQDYSIPLRVSGNHLKLNSNKKFSIGISDKLVCIGPKFVSKRIMSNDGQTIYDLSIATLNFLDEHKFLDYKTKRIALRKVISRCWTWSRRKNNKNYFSNEFIIYLKNKLGLNYSTDFVRYHVFNTWRNQENIRKFNRPNYEKKKILVYVGLDLLGDALLKMPFLRSLKLIFPDSEITWLAGKGESVFNNSLKEISKGLIDKVNDKLAFGSSIKDLFYNKNLDNYHIVFDTQKRFLTTLILKKINCDIFISQSSNYFFSNLVPNFKNESNLSQQLINLAEIFYYKKIKFNTYTFNKKSKKVVICPGASVDWKCWRLENYIQTADYLKTNGFQPIFILGPGERNLENTLRKRFKSDNIFVSNNPNMTINLSKKARIGIANDTGCGHLLAISGIPLLTIFGPTNYKKFRPIGNPSNQSISSKEIYNSNDINSLKIRDVIKEVDKLLQAKVS